MRSAEPPPKVRAATFKPVVSPVRGVAMPQNQNQEQVDKNYAAFRQMLPELLKTQTGKFALLKDEQVVDFFDTARDAYTAGIKLYPDGIFSVQEVTETPADLGYFSHAVP